ncbi:MAG: polysaccharide deacetylase family protein [Campylobacterales bacterium]|nr:polysaccharide deacetylase family protein [Campylobacterales bacterium]
MRLFVLLLITLWLYGGVENYRVINHALLYQNKPFRAIRSFEINHILHYLIVDETSLQTSIIQTTFLPTKPTDTPYQRLLQKYSQPPYWLQNYGLTSIESDKIYITTDLCPSSKRGYERHFYQDLIKHYPNPVDITLFISSKWIDRHLQEFQELVRWSKEGKLNIIWGNHTHTHPYRKGVANSSNFLLLKGVNIEKEVIELEKKLIGYGITPSIFFRFPGLVQNQEAVMILNRLGLIPVGSNAWLAKGERLKNGSILLLHGNKNEPQGIKKATILFKHPYQIGSLLDVAH